MESVGQRWQKGAIVSLLISQKYEAQAAEDKKRYEAEKEKYVPPPASSESDNSDDEKPAKKRKRAPKAKKDPNKPKKSMSSFMYFANDKRPSVREKYPDLKMTDIGKKLSELWRAITPDEKKVCREDQLLISRNMRNWPPKTSSDTRNRWKNTRLPNRNQNQKKLLPVIPNQATNLIRNKMFRVQA